MDAAPWFGPALLAGAFAILGALIGLTATWLSDRRKFRREDEQRFHDVIRQTGAQLITQLLEARQQLRIAQRLPVDSPDRQIALVRKRELVGAARGSQDSLKFVASRAVNDRALDLIQTVETLTETSSQEMMSQVWIKLDSFVDEVRKELNLRELAGARKSTL